MEMEFYVYDTFSRISYGVNHFYGAGVWYPEGFLRFMVMNNDDEHLSENGGKM